MSTPGNRQKNKLKLFKNVCKKFHFYFSGLFQGWIQNFCMGVQTHQGVSLSEFTPPPQTHTCTHTPALHLPRFFYILVQAMSTGSLIKTKQVVAQLSFLRLQFKASFMFSIELEKPKIRFPKQNQVMFKAMIDYIRKKKLIILQSWISFQISLINPCSIILFVDLFHKFPL